MKKTTKTAASTTGRTATAKKAATGGGWRRCEAPGCGSSFRPRSDRQIYCSPACKVRAFYWSYKENEGERYAARYERQRKKAASGASRGRSAARKTGARRATASRAKKAAPRRRA
jgi:hypothetical protein